MKNVKKTFLHPRSEPLPLHHRVKPPFIMLKVEQKYVVLNTIVFCYLFSFRLFYCRIIFRSRLSAGDFDAQTLLLLNPTIASLNCNPQTLSSP